MSAVLYARVSTIEQAERDLSIPAQLRALHKYAEDNNIEIFNEYSDVASGTHLKERPGLLAALNSCTRNSKVKMLIVHKVDRMARNTLDYLMLRHKLKQHNVEVVSLVEHFEETPVGNLLEHIMASLAEFYSANLSLEAKKGLRERFERGLWTNLAPPGYINIPSGVELDQTKAPHIRTIFVRWATGMTTTRELEEYLAEQGVVGRRGARISGRHISLILKNPFYVGIMKTTMGTKQGIHEPLIDTETFERCQEVFRLKHSGGQPRHKLDFQLAGALKCPKCGRLLTGERHARTSGKVYRYYRCHQIGCKYSIAASRVEHQEDKTDEGDCNKDKLPDADTLQPPPTT
jgi:DNA invertase Pin-like site-specific DNA recombinase